MSVNYGVLGRDRESWNVVNAGNKSVLQRVPQCTDRNRLCRSADLVLGSIFGDDADSRYEGSTVPKATRHQALRNCVSDIAQAPSCDGSDRRDRIGAKWPVEIDETYIGGATQGEGRGRHHKTLVVGMV
jgi:hypothetical protein